MQLAKVGNENDLHHESPTELSWRDIRWEDLPLLYKGFSPIASRELPFAVAKFLAFDIVAKVLVTLINSQPDSIPIQVGVGTTGLAVSALAGAVAGIAGAFISHPADLVLTLTSSTAKKTDEADKTMIDDEFHAHENSKTSNDKENSADWRPIVKELISKDGGLSNLFIGFPARATFFFLVIGLQFFLYDYVKNLLDVGSDDLTLVLDVFYAVRRGLVEMDSM